jgi:succinate dehydrogenase flavin-adding protein (antitoxin of CptAB toxin-antitoxin module)
MNNQTTLNIIQKLGWETLPLEQQEYLIEKTGGLIFQKIFAQLMAQLTEPEQEELDALLSVEDVDTAKLLAFIQEKIPNSDQIIQKEVGTFLQEADDIMSKI